MTYGPMYLQHISKISDLRFKQIIHNVVSLLEIVAK